jgi:hypothetical protein
LLTFTFPCQPLISQRNDGDWFSASRVGTKCLELYRLELSGSCFWECNIEKRAIIRRQIRTRQDYPSASKSDPDRTDQNRWVAILLARFALQFHLCHLFTVKLSFLNYWSVEKRIAWDSWPMVFL